jgi:hypothetical protein
MFCQIKDLLILNQRYVLSNQRLVNTKLETYYYKS